MMNRRQLIPGLAALVCLQGATMLPAQAKRVAPPAVAPVREKGVEYRAEHERYSEKGAPAGIRGFLTAVDEKSGKELWKARLYDRRFQGQMETDVQEVYVKSLHLEAPGILAITEDETGYLVSREKHTVRKLPEVRGSLANLGGPGGPKIWTLSGDKKTCELHQVTMGEDIVPMRYGLIRFLPEEAKARMAKFPNANTTQMGGCVVRPTAWAQVRFCSRCREAEAIWRQDGKQRTP